MRVLQIHKDFEPLKGGGGTARHIHGLARALATENCDVRVVAPDAEHIESPYHSVRATASQLGEHVKWADVVHVHGARSTYAVRGAILAALNKKPFFYTPHAFYGGDSIANSALKAVWDRTAEKFLLEKGARTILLTDAWFDFLSERGISAKKTSIIPNCVMGSDIAQSVSRTSIAGRPAILSVGRLDAVKRLDDVVRALADPILEHAHLHIVGKGAERERLERRATDLGVGSRVTFHGFVDDQGVAEMMRGADAFVLASEQEGLPTVLLEALMSGLPVVCSRIPGNLAIMDVAQIDTTYEVADVTALAQRLAESVETSVSPVAAERLQKAFTWEYRAPEVLRLYQNSITQSSRL